MGVQIGFIWSTTNFFNIQTICFELKKIVHCKIVGRDGMEARKLQKSLLSVCSSAIVCCYVGGWKKESQRMLSASFICPAIHPVSQVYHDHLQMTSSVTTTSLHYGDSVCTFLNHYWYIHPLLFKYQLFPCLLVYIFIQKNRQK